MIKLLSILLTILISVTSLASDIIVKSTDLSQLKNSRYISKVELMVQSNDPYFKNLHRVWLKESKKVLELSQEIKKLKGVESVELVHQAKLFTIEPTSNTVLVNNEPLSQYQWALRNQKQMIRRDLDQISSQKVQGVIGQDIQYSFNAEPANKTVVAVIDSGVDYNHPDLADSIFKNDLDCNQTGPNIIDFDQNNYPGDCLGWNFTQPKNSPLARRPMDNDGHGTHVAGIIAAQINSIGISGISNNLKILPIKVLDDRNQTGASTDLLSMAILYAVDRGVDVINFSMGWTKSMDTEYLRRAIQIAISRNIPVIAAAGNNSSNDSIYPCAYPNVICVGATGIDGSMASFSNHGGFVDVLAPGEQILSTTQHKYLPNNFFVNGYDIKSGTSQASPYVAALAALIKAKFPEEKINSISARIFESALTAPIDKLRNKTSLHGLIQFDKALNMEPVVSIKPTFKEMEQVYFRKRDGKLGFKLPVKNYWKEVENITVKIESLNKSIELVNDTFNLNQLTTNQVALLPVMANIKDLDIDNIWKFKVLITKNEENDSTVLGNFSHQVPLVRFLDDDTDLKSTNFEYRDSAKPIGMIQNNKIVPLIKPVVDKYFLNENTMYYLPKFEEEQGYRIHLFTNVDGKLHEQKHDIVIPHAKTLLNIQVLPITENSKGDILIRSIAKNGDDEYVLYSYFNRDGSPLFGEDSHWRFDPESVLLDFNDARLVWFNHPTHGKMRQLIFSAVANTSQADQPRSPWEMADNSVRNNIYFLEPQIKDKTTHLVTRTLSTIDVFKSWRTAIGINPLDMIELKRFINQDEKDLLNGQAKFMLSSGSGYFQRIFVIEINSIKIDKPISISEITGLGVDPDNSNLATVVGLDQNKADNYSAHMWIQFYDRISTIDSIMKFIDSKFVVDDINYYQHHDVQDHIIGYLSSFHGDEFGQVSFYQSRNQLIAHHTKDGVLNTSMREIIRFSFMPGFIFDQLFSAMTIKRENKKLPALYVDGTQITNDHLEVYMLDLNNQLYAPILQSVRTPKNCEPLAPSYKSHGSIYTHSFLCLDQQRNWSIKNLDLSL